MTLNSAIFNDKKQVKQVAVSNEYSLINTTK